MLSRSEFVVDLVADAARAIELVGPTGGGRDAPRAIAKPSPSMKLVSVNVGLPRQAIWHGMRGTTDIFKEPILGSVPIHKLNLSGDVQAELTVHGGRDKAVYGYPSEDYDWWRTQLARVFLASGHFGENPTMLGLDERAVLHRPISGSVRQS